MPPEIPFSIRLQNFWTRLRHWEYWPMHVVYLPIYAYWLWLSFRERTFFYFSAANPGIPSGGMLGESKFEILGKIPAPFKPVTIRLEPAVTQAELVRQLEWHGMDFPIIAKPDVGERGWLVEKIHNQQALEQYRRKIKVPFLIQPYVEGPLELGVFYYRIPGAAKGVVSSVIVKEFLTLTGDGQATVESLILRNPRAALQYAKLREQYDSVWYSVLPKGRKLELEPIGNHCRGTAFLNGNAIINKNLTEVFDCLSHSIEGFYYGRYDLRCTGLDDLYRGEGIQILELNGVGAEPGHIYHPGFSLWKGYQVLFRHWSVMHRIARLNHLSGVPYMTMGEVWRTWRSIQKSRNLQLEKEKAPEIRSLPEEKPDEMPVGS